MNLQTGKVCITKKALCVILSIIMAFGTFITFTVGYSPLHEWMGIRNMLSAYAAEFVDTDGAVAVDEDAMLADDHTINLENKDGSNTVYLFSEPISYTDDNGNIKTKDISVEKAGYELKKEGYDFTNGQNDYRINFSKDYNKGIQAEFEGASYSIIPQSIIKVDGEEAVAEYLDENFEVFQYKNIYGNGTNLRFYPQLNGVKDEIILNQNINKNTFSFELKTENCTAQLNEDSTISLVNKEGITIQTFAAPFAYDSEYVEGDNTNHYVDCEYILEDKNETSYIMTITVPNEWLNNANTKYPVTIDPTTSNISQAKDAGTYKKYKTQNWGSEQLCCFGYSSDYDKGRVYTQFTLPTAIKKGAIIKEAYQWERECTGRTTSTKVIAYMVKASWSETGITWENKPGYNSNYASNKRTINSNSSDNSSPYWYKFNIKSIVNQWINGGSANYGITFRSDEEDNLNKNWRAFAAKNHSTSAYRPYTKITYENDDRGPKYDVEKSPTTWTNGNVTVTIKNVQDLNHDGGTSPVAGIPTNAYSITTSSTPSYSSSKSKSFSKNCSVNTTVKDNNNNPTTKTVTITNIDKLNPNVPTKVSGNDGAWTNQNVVVKVAVSDRAKTDNDGCSGIASYSCTKSATPSSNSSDWKSVSDGATQITLPAISSYGTYYVFVKDKAGNISSYPYTKRDYENNSTHTVTYKGYQFTAYIDKTEPVIDDVNLHYDEELGHNVLTVEAHDENEGCNYCAGMAYYSVDGGNTWKNSYTESYTFSDLSDVETIDVAVKDKAGNITHYDENPQVKVPIMYQEDKYVKIINPNENLKLQYKINDGSYIDYNEPIELENGVQTTITAIISGTNKSVTKTFTYQAPATATPYTEEQTDITITDNSASFDVSRYYNSNTNNWFFSTQSAISEIEENYVYSVQMPDSQILYFVNENNQLINEDTDYTLTIEDTSYVIDCGDYSLHYNKDNGRLSCVDDKNGHGINFSYTNDKLTSIYAEEGNERHEYSITEDNDGKIQSITTPLGEKLKYDYSSGKIVKVYYDKAHLQYTRNDDIIISEYEYLNNRVLKTNGNTVNYDGNGHYVSITTTWNETIGNEPEQTEQGQQGNEQGTVELDFSSEYPVFYEGTETVHYEKSGYTIGKTAYITENEYNTDSQLITVTETQTVNYGTANPEVIYTKVTAYTYYENSDTVHTKTVTETENSGTTTTATSYTYGNWGNVLTETNSKFENGVSVPVSSNTYIYDSLNRCIKETLSVPNENDVVTLYAYNPLDEIIYEKCGNEVTRTLYDQYNRVVQEIEPQDYNSSADEISLNADGYPEGNDRYSDSNVGNRYVYNETTRLLTQETNRLEVVTNYTYHTNSGVVATENFDIYRYEYNTDGILTDIFVANTTPAYAHYVYDTYKNNTEIHYGNGQKVYYSYDSNKNLTSQSYTNASETTPIVQFTYSYNADNELTSKTDCVNNRRTDYNGNTVSVYDTSGNSAVLLYSYANTEEDTITNTPATAQKSYAGNTLDVTYGANTNQYKLNNDDVFSVNSTYTDEQLSSTVINNPSNQAVISKSYDYDDNNKITDITVNNTQISYVYDDDKITEYHQGNDVVYYHYDNKNQLVREDINYSNYSRTITYTYDTRGNLTEKKEYPYTRNENPGTPLESNDLEFEYEDELWLDEIVETPTETILYDENGNPYNLEDCTLEWTNGRQLKSVSNGNDVILEYTYDDNGIRTSKTYQGVTTYYCTENGVITSQYQLDTSGNKENEVIFIYDNGSLVSAYYDSAMYYYITNAMGDVISIIDESGNTVVDYCYDAWGNVVDKVVNTTLTTDFADVNPMLYRSYYYDDDLAVYYLRSRYYKSDWCRFINLDLPKYARIQKDIISNLNLFVYCYNNPVAYFDSAGKLPLYLSYKMYMYSKQNMKDKKNYVVFSQNTEIGKLLGRRVKKSGKLKKIYKSLYKELKYKSGTATKSYNEFIHFKTYNILSIDGDLYLSVGHATVYFVMNKKNKKNKKNKYEYYVTVTIRDIYDFKTIEKETDESFFDKAVRYINNKYGADMQYVSLYPYTWTFVYTFKYK